MTLSAREQSILSLIAEGRSDEAITNTSASQMTPTRLELRMSSRS